MINKNLYLDVSAIDSRAYHQKVVIGPIVLYFYYSDVIAFFYVPENRLVISENWTKSRNLGMYLNKVDVDRSKRISRDQFLIELERMLDKHGLLLPDNS